MHRQPASPARHNYRFTIGEQECAEHQPARPELVPSVSVAHHGRFRGGGELWRAGGRPRAECCFHAGERSSDCWTARSTGQLVRRPERASRAALGVSSTAAPRSAQSASGSAVSSERGLQSPDAHGALLVCGLVTRDPAACGGLVPAGRLALPARRRPGPGCRPNRRTHAATRARPPLRVRRTHAPPARRPVLVARDELGRQVGAGSRQPPSACPTRGSPRARGRRLFGGAGAVGE
jgi:hypothetical protein